MQETVTKLQTGFFDGNDSKGGAQEMTDIANTVEMQLGELARQYKHAENIISGLMDEREHMAIRMADLERQLCEARERQCRCACADIPCQC